MTISNRNGSQASQQQSDRPAPGTVTRGEYPRGFVGGTPVSVMVYVNLSLLRDEARARKLLPGVPSLPVNQEARIAILVARHAEVEATGLPAVRQGVVDTGVSPMSTAFKFGVPRFGLGFYGKTLANRGYRLTEAYFQEGEVVKGRRRAPRLCLVFDGRESFFGKLPTLPESICDQISDFLEKEVFDDGHVWDNTCAAAGTMVLNCCLTPSQLERNIRFTDMWSAEVVEL